MQHRPRCNCPSCNMAIFLLDHWAGYVAALQPCKLCDSCGVCPNCGGRSADPKGTSCGLCKLCENTGVCPMCGGERVVYE